MCPLDNGVGLVVLFIFVVVDLSGRLKQWLGVCLVCCDRSCKVGFCFVFLSFFFSFCCSPFLRFLSFRVDPEVSGKELHFVT